ncbi:hypothetical protein GCM10009067_41910 [Haloarcula sebkhae]|uniref:Uncharacterized protein n=1 Tax=Haloarcula sebkhae TaxID=932660 RepID=A0A830EQN6_9EURY|nr:hypothetical protein GCM10009067_41910 [Haloarcula sebkhae]
MVGVDVVGERAIACRYSYPGSPASHPSHILLGSVYGSGLLGIPPDKYAELGYLDY